MGHSKILMLGGTGTLSSAVLYSALQSGFCVTVMNRGSRNTTLPEGVQTVICDFYNREDLLSRFKNCYFDVVIDFLSRTPVDIERVYPIFRNSCIQYIFISTACVYRRAKEDFPIKEDSPKPNLDWSYNVQKYNAELKLRELSICSSSYYTIIRPYITYNDERIPLGVTPAYRYHKTIIERIKAGKQMFIWDGGSHITTVTHTTDFARAVVGLFLNEKAVNEDFHVTSDYRYSQKEVLEILYKKLDLELNIVDFTSEEMGKILPEYDNMLIGDRALDAFFDNSKIKSAVKNLEFNVNLENGIDRILMYWNSKQSSEFDYVYEARIDKLISKKVNGIKYVNYGGSQSQYRLIYLLYRYLPYSIASLISKAFMK